jgi:hypothetical protein
MASTPLLSPAFRTEGADHNLRGASILERRRAATRLSKGRSDDRFGAHAP